MFEDPHSDASSAAKSREVEEQEQDEDDGTVANENIEYVLRLSLPVNRIIFSSVRSGCMRNLAESFK
jgi:hypothetical protein